MAQVDCFLKIDGVTSESKDAKHTEEVEVESWSWGEANMGSSGHGGGAGTGKVLPQDLNIIKRVDKSSPVLFIHCSTGTPFKSAILTQRKSGEGQQDYLIITMENVMVSSYQVNGSGEGGAIPTESLALNFDSLEFSYKPQDDAGALGGEVKQKYSFKENVKV